MSLQHKIDYSIDLLRKAEPLALKMHPDGFYLAFSGGKDSLVLYHIAKMAGVKFTAHYNLTTLDPPELVYFIKANYPDVTIHRPEMSFLQLIKHKKMLPLRQARYCCAYLKEGGGIGRCTLIGVRAAESTKRAKRNEVEVDGYKFTGSLDQFNIYNETAHVCMSGKDKVMISPIFRWIDADVWNFIRGKQIEYCSLYDEGYHRIGCIFCPMAQRKIKALDRTHYPKYETAIKKAIQYLIDNYDYGKEYRATADELFDWWCSNESQRTFFGMLRNQMKLNL